MGRNVLPNSFRALACSALLVTISAIFSSSPRDEPPNYCTVFNHFVKSGGSTIKSQLNHQSIIQRNRSPGLITGVLRTTPAMRLDMVHNASVIMGYGEQLRKPLHDIGRKCSYFTVFRHPIDRLVSKFYYCPMDHDPQQRPSKFCGHNDIVGHSRKSRLLEFAREASANSAFLNMMQSKFCLPSFETSICDPKHALEVELWPTDLTTIQGREAHQVAMETLSTYTAVGIFEEWELSMQLFDATVTSPVSQWDAHKVANIGLRSADREALLDWAHTSSELFSVLGPDLLLYEYAATIFRRQTSDILGTVWG